MHRAIDLEMKHYRELVIIFLVAMQGCSYLISQASGKSLRDPELW